MYAENLGLCRECMVRFLILKNHSQGKITLSNNNRDNPTDNNMVS